MLPKVPILSKNVSNKNCSELNFLQKKKKENQWPHISISPRSGTGEAPKICVFEILCSEMRKFTLQLNAAKITNYNKKYFK